MTGLGGSWPTSAKDKGHAVANPGPSDGTLGVLSWLGSGTGGQEKAWGQPPQGHQVEGARRPRELWVELGRGWRGQLRSG